MRGTLREVEEHLKQVRFIPAHAGNTNSASDLVRDSSVHPRACGEHTGSRVKRSTGCGSSPRMRGTRCRRRSAEDPGRFIPAHAGNTLAIGKACAITPVHPRACGEHSATNSPALPKRGSSPRMRGTLKHFLRNRAFERFIPAHAGNTGVKQSGRSHSSVHPRACGEHSAPTVSAKGASGSSPRMRGTQILLIYRELEERFIPAHAGNTQPRQFPRRGRPVHPRACGEHKSSSSTANSKSGSSPRMRGTLSPDSFREGGVRFIPAHAGNTFRRNVVNSCHPVHPRACGEHPPDRVGNYTQIGSSPRMRGTHPQRDGKHQLRRFIPAHAGNTIPPKSCVNGLAVHPRACGEHLRAITIGS